MWRSPVWRSYSLISLCPQQRASCQEAPVWLANVRYIRCQFFASVWYKKALGEPNWLIILGWYQRNPCTQLPRREVWVSACVCVCVCVKTFIRSVQQLKGHLDYLQINQKVLPACLNQKLAHAESLFQICVPLAPPTVWIIPSISVTQWICDGITAIFSEAQSNTWTSTEISSPHLWHFA